MRKYNFNIWFLVALLLAGCATVPLPESNNERLALLEITYGTLLDKATLYANEGRLTASQKSAALEAFHQIDVAIEVAAAAIGAADQGAFDNSTKAINAGLNLVRTILVEAENE